MYKLTFLCLAIIFPFTCYCQSGTIQITPGNLELTTPDSAVASISVATSSFSHQLFLSVESTDLPAQASVSFPTNPLEYPYTNGEVKIVNSGLETGSYKIVIKAANGPVIAYDTCYLRVSNFSCSWDMNIPQVPSSYSSITKMAIDSNGTQWYCTGYGLVKYDNINWTYYPPSSFGLTIGELDHIDVDINNSVWFNSEEGLTKFTGTSYINYLPGNSQIPSANISSVECDHSGNVWLGTDKGLAKFDGTFWTTFNTSNSPLTSDLIEKVKEDQKGNIWVICKIMNSDDLFKYDGSNWIKFSYPDFCLNENIDISDIAVDTMDNLWVALKYDEFQVLKISENHVEAWGRQETISNRNYTMTSLADCSLITQNKSSNLSMNFTNNITISENGKIWVSGNSSINNSNDYMGKVARFKNNNWEVFSSINSNLSPTYTFGHVTDKSGKLWAIFNKDFSDYSGPFIHSTDCREEILTHTPPLIVIDKNTFVIYPNPASNVLQISNTFQENGLYTLNIFNNQGQLVLTKNGEFNSSEIILNISSLDKGIYFVSLNQNGRYTVQKFVKN